MQTFLSIPSSSQENPTMVHMFHPNTGQAGVMAGLGKLKSIPSRKVTKEEFMKNSGKLSYSFSHSEGTSPNKRILAVLVHPNGYETFGYAKNEGWKHYLFS